MSKRKNKAKDQAPEQASEQAPEQAPEQDQKPQGPEAFKGKGKAFFDRAAQVAETGNWDYAIEMYLQGVGREPTEVEQGHQNLREAALQRKASGGKGASFFEARKRKPTKDPIENLVNAEWMMTRDPANPSHWRQIIAAAKAGQWPDVVRWACGVLYDINRMAKKASKEIYMFLMQTYTDLAFYAEAGRVCRAALQMTPDDPKLTDALRDLSAQETMQKGRYDEEGDFTKSVVDIKGQMDLAKQDQISQDEKFLLEQVEKARNAYEADPDTAGKVNALVDALVRLDDESFENEAIDVLTKAHNDSGVYRHKVRIGDIKIRQMTRRYRKLVKADDKDGAIKLAKEQLAFELAEFAERATNYPTDLSLKFELGRRQFVAGQYDEAIALLQQARRDPKRRLHAMSALGLAFFRKGWHTEAAETFEQALELEMSENRAKDIHYNLGLVYEAMGEGQKALGEFSVVAQLDFNYKDARQRIETLRGRGGAGEEGA